jgi:hypothetical protein
MSKLERGIMEYLTLHYGESPLVSFGNYGPMMYNPTTFEPVYKQGHSLNGEYFCRVWPNEPIPVFNHELLQTLDNLFNVHSDYSNKVITDWVRIHCPDCLIPNKERITSPHLV